MERNSVRLSLNTHALMTPLLVCQAMGVTAYLHTRITNLICRGKDDTAFMYLLGHTRHSHRGSVVGADGLSCATAAESLMVLNKEVSGRYVRGYSGWAGLS